MPETQLDPNDCDHASIAPPDNVPPDVDAQRCLGCGTLFNRVPLAQQTDRYVVVDGLLGDL